MKHVYAACLCQIYVACPCTCSMSTVLFSFCLPRAEAYPNPAPPLSAIAPLTTYNMAYTYMPVPKYCTIAHRLCLLHTVICYRNARTPQPLVECRYCDAHSTLYCTLYCCAPVPRSTVPRSAPSTTVPLYPALSPVMYVVLLCPCTQHCI